MSNESTTTNTTHTPGPWEFATKWCDHVTSNHGDVAIVTDWRESGIARTILERRSNARLIAAAPELLQELQNIANAKQFDRESLPTDADFIAWAKNRANYAIAKVTGATA